MFKAEVDGNHLIIRLFVFKNFKGIRLTFRNPFAPLFNKVFLVDEKGNTKRVFKIKGLKIIYTGTNSTVYVHKPTRFRGNCQILLSSNCYANIGSYKNRIRDLDIRLMNGCSIDIKNNFSCAGATIFTSTNYKTKITIGEDCLFSDNITIMTTDSHKIFNKDDSEQIAINPDKDITIGNHVWVGKNVMILKNTKISDFSIVGANSLVNKPFEEENIILAGYPAKKVKENINWSQKF